MFVNCESVPKMTELALVYSTCASMSEARKLALGVLDMRLAACVNIVPSVVSLYHWQGKVEEASECVLMFKTRKTLANAVVAYIEKHHPYDIAAASVVPVTNTTEAYGAWIMGETSTPDF
jgi:periplasmic divalent cation tolerance protein